MQYSCILVFLPSFKESIGDNTMIRSILLVCIAWMLVFQPLSAEVKIPVFVSIAPQHYFVQQIGKNRVDIQIMVQPGASPHLYEPKPRQMVAISKAKLYFAIGTEFEEVWLRKLSTASPNMKIVRTDAGIQKIPVAGHDRDHDQDHHEEPDHAEEGLDPHIWLSPQLVKKQSLRILEALQTVDPTASIFYENNYRVFITKLSRLDTEFKGIFQQRQGFQFMVFHPSWGYFARSYGLKQVPIEIEGKNPKPAQLRDIITYARKHQIKVIFVQPQFSARNANLIAREIGGEVISVDPMARDWLQNLRVVANTFKAALK